MKYVIIGAGAAGLTCVRHLIRFSNVRDITLISSEKTLPYSRMVLPYILSGLLSFEDAQIMLTVSINYIKDAKVVKIDADNKSVTTERGRDIHFDKLLIASGSVPYVPPIEGLKKCRRWTCVKDIGDIERIKYFIKHTHSSNVILAGAGLVNMEIGEALRMQGMNLIYIVSSDKVLSSILDKQASKLIETHLQNKGVRIIKGQSVRSIDCAPDSINAILTDGTDVEGCCVVFGKGVIPSIDFLSGSGISRETGIPVDTYLRTNKEDIFAAGDVAETDDMLTGMKKLHPIRPAAVMQGKIAAYNMQRLSFKYSGEIMSNILTIGGKTVFSAGDSKRESPYIRIFNGNYAKVVLKNDRLEGALFVGDNIRNPEIYIELIKKRVSAKSMIRPMLTNSLSNYYIKYYTNRFV